MNKLLKRPGLIIVWLLNITFILWAIFIFATVLFPNAMSDVPDAGLVVGLVFIYNVLIPFWLLSLINFAYVSQAVAIGRKRTVLKSFFGLIVFFPVVYLILGVAYSFVTLFFR